MLVSNGSYFHSQRGCVVWFRKLMGWYACDSLLLTCPSTFWDPIGVSSTCDEHSQVVDSSMSVFITSKDLPCHNAECLELVLVSITLCCLALRLHLVVRSEGATTLNS